MNEIKVKIKDINNEFDFLHKRQLLLGKSMLESAFEVSKSVKNLMITVKSPSLYLLSRSFNKPYLDKNFKLNGKDIDDYSIDSKIISQFEIDLLSEIVFSDVVLYYLYENYGTDFVLEISKEKKELVFNILND